MSLQRVHLALTQLRCIKQRDHDGSGGSDPYLWVSYFAIGAVQLPGQLGGAGVITPSYDAFRLEMPNDIQDGQVMLTPPFISNASFDMYLDPAGNTNKRVGIIAILLEENETPHNAIIHGRIAYSKEIDIQLNELIKQRFLENNLEGDLTDEELDNIEDAVEGKVTEAIKSQLSIWNLFDDQDKVIGTTFIQFKNDDIKFQYFDFPPITDSTGDNVFVLTGRLSLGPVPVEPVDLCANQRQAYEQKRREIRGLETRRYFLQQSLQTAPPSHKASIVNEINETNARIESGRAELDALATILQQCIDRGNVGGGNVGGNVGGTVGGGVPPVGPG